MKNNAVTKSQMAKMLKTSRTGLERLLNPTNYSVTLLTLNRAASVLGKTISINLTTHEKPKKHI